MHASLDQSRPSCSAVRSRRSNHVCCRSSYPCSGTGHRAGGGHGLVRQLSASPSILLFKLVKSSQRYQINRGRLHCLINGMAK